MLPVMTLYTPAKVSREEYESILGQLDGVSFPGQGYHPRASRDQRSVEFVLAPEEERDLLLQGLAVPIPSEVLEDDLQDGEASEGETYLERLIRLLGKQPVTVISMYMNHEVGTKNIVVDFVQLFHQHYACVVITPYGEVYTPEQFVDCAEPGYDGYRLDATRTHVVKGSPETAAEKSKRLARVRREKVLAPGGLKDVVFTLYLGNLLSEEELTQALAEMGAEILQPRGFYAAQIIRDERKVLFHVSPPADFQRRWDELAQREREAIERALGEVAHGLLDLHAVKPLPSVNLALDFMVAFAKRYRCVVQDGSGEIHAPTELLEFAQPGIDGYRWDAEHQVIVKDGA